MIVYSLNSNTDYGYAVSLSPPLLTLYYYVLLCDPMWLASLDPKGPISHVRIIHIN